MPLVHITGEPIKITCTKPFSPEFPTLLTETSTDDEIEYFDATAFLESLKNEALSVDRFFLNFQFQQRAIINSYKLDPKKTVRVDPNNHILIDVSFAYLFISYVEPDFIAYINNKIVDMFQDGMVFSDSFIAAKAKDQLGDDVLMSLAHGADSTTGEGKEPSAE